MTTEQLDNFTLSNVEVWLPDGIRHRQSFRVKHGRLVEWSEHTSMSSTEVIDGHGLVFMPAGVDAQVHLRVPGQGHKELPETGVKAALRGGYAAVLTMPNTQPTVDSLAALKQGQELVHPFEKQYGVKVFWSAAITKRLNSDELTPFEDLVAHGVRAFTNDGLGVISDNVMDEAFARLERFSTPLLQHAEFLGHGGSLAPGSVQRKIGAKPYPPEPEWQMVERDIRMLRKHPKAHYHVLHVSAHETIELVRSAKREGLNVTAEVTPHHLFFNCEQIDPENKSFKMNPPIRAEEDRLALWAALEDKTIDFVSTDHAPHEPLMKSSSFDDSAFGTIGMETTLGVLLDGWKKGLLTPGRFVEVFSQKPARFLHLPEEFGQFKVGETLHGILVDVHAPHRMIFADDFASLSRNSCFIGQSLPGKLRRAIHGGQLFSF